MLENLHRTSHSRIRYEKCARKCGAVRKYLRSLLLAAAIHIDNIFHIHQVPEERIHKLMSRTRKLPDIRHIHQILINAEFRGMIATDALNTERCRQIPVLRYKVNNAEKSLICDNRRIKLLVRRKNCFVPASVVGFNCASINAEHIDHKYNRDNRKISSLAEFRFYEHISQYRKRQQNKRGEVPVRNHSAENLLADLGRQILSLHHRREFRIYIADKRFLKSGLINKAGKHKRNCYANRREDENAFVFSHLGAHFDNSAQAVARKN